MVDRTHNGALITVEDEKRKITVCHHDKLVKFVATEPHWVARRRAELATGVENVEEEVAIVDEAATEDRAATDEGATEEPPTTEQVAHEEGSSGELIERRKEAGVEPRREYQHSNLLLRDDIDELNIELMHRMNTAEENYRTRSGREVKAPNRLGVDRNREKDED